MSFLPDEKLTQVWCHLETRSLLVLHDKPELQKIWSQLALQSETLKVAQQVKVLACKSEDLSLSPGTPMRLGGENQLHK